MKKKKDEIAFTLSSSTLYGTVIVILVALLTLSVFTQGFGVLPCETGYCTPCPEEEVTPPAGDGETAVQEVPEEQPTIPEISLSEARLPPLGEENAPITLIEVSDYQCPFCWRLYANSMESVKENYVDAGKAKMYFVDFPLSSHQHAMSAAIAASCANDQGKFWDMHNMIFDGQESWSGAYDATPIFEGYASDLGLDTGTFSTCLANEEHADEIAVDMSEAASWGVQGTPGVFVVVPKDKLSYEDASAALDNIYATYGSGGVLLFQDGEEWVFFVAGAYPYEVFDELLSAVSY